MLFLSMFKNHTKILKIIGLAKPLKRKVGYDIDLPLGVFSCTDMVKRMLN